MSNIAIRCEGLSKQYRIGDQERYKALRDVITDAAAALHSVVCAPLSTGVSRPWTEMVPVYRLPSPVVVPTVAGHRSPVIGQPSADSSSIRNSKSEIRATGPIASSITSSWALLASWRLISAAEIFLCWTVGQPGEA